MAKDVFEKKEKNKTNTEKTAKTFRKIFFTPILFNISIII
jgi:hypothetical protein